MRWSETTADIIEAIETLSPEEQVLLSNWFEKRRNYTKNPLLNIPSTLVKNPLFQEVLTNIENYRYYSVF